jgi:hypothetical protein
MTGSLLNRKSRKVQDIINTCIHTTRHPHTTKQDKDTLIQEKTESDPKLATEDKTEF